MCGLTGVLGTAAADRTELELLLRRMADTLRHRGPDDHGTWTDPSGRAGFGFRRLSIQDLSPNGHQPMSSASGRITLVFNGEIYNHFELRHDLERRGYRFRGHSDTETLCAAIEAWGMARTAARCIGMFAVAVWDERDQTLALMRDRLGIKPLYVHTAPDLVLFGSELKALRAHPRFHAELDLSALHLYFRYLYVPAPRTIFSNVRKVRPGSILTIHAADLRQEEAAYWSVEEAYEKGRSDPFPGDEAEAVAELDGLLSESVRMRLLSDVPVGALLSGGIDSSTVVALMQRESPRPARTFTIGFAAGEHDESRHAARIAEHLGTEHTELVLDADAALQVVPQLAHVFDEPLADPSQIPTLLVSRLARHDVTVALTGDGGDEVFGGYNRYISGQHLIARWARMPWPVRRAAAIGAHFAAGPLYGALEPALRRGGQRLLRLKLRKLGRLLREDNPARMYRSLLSTDIAPAAILDSGAAADDPVLATMDRMSALPLLDRMMTLDQMYYLPDDLLAKVDRASMATGLEARVPLLDHRVLEFSWRLPAAWKIQAGQGKRLLQSVLHRHVPKALVERPKVGFSVPIEEWLRGRLAEWAGDLLCSAAPPLNRHGLERAWTRLQQRDGHGAASLWAGAMFEAWRREWTV